MPVEAEPGDSGGGTMRWLAGHSEWMLLVGVVPALLAVVTVELLVGPEVVELLVGQLVQGVDAEPRFARGMIMMSALTVSYLALCLALLAYYCSAVGARPLPAGRKRRLAVAGIAAWIGFHAVLAGLGVVDLQLYSIAYDSILRIYEQAGGPVAAAMTGEVGPLGVSRHLTRSCCRSRSASRRCARVPVTPRRSSRAPGEETTAIEVRPPVMRRTAWCTR